MSQEHKRQLKTVMKRSLTLPPTFMLSCLITHGLDMIYKAGLFIIVLIHIQSSINTFNHQSISRHIDTLSHAH
jgi:hypothetical protein